MESPVTKLYLKDVDNFSEQFILLEGNKVKRVNIYACEVYNTQTFDDGDLVVETYDNNFVVYKPAYKQSDKENFRPDALVPHSKRETISKIVEMEMNWVKFY